MFVFTKRIDDMLSKFDLITAFVMAATNTKPYCPFVANYDEYLSGSFDVVVNQSTSSGTVQHLEADSQPQ